MLGSKRNVKTRSRVCWDQGERPRTKTRKAKGERRKQTATKANDANEAKGNDTATTWPTTNGSNHTHATLF